MKSEHKEVSLTQWDTLSIFFAGHEWIVKYDERTNENLVFERRY
jgi:hypothetical protein